MDSIRLAEFVGLPSALGWSHVATISTTQGVRSVLCFAVSGSQASAIGHELVAILRSTAVETEQALYELIISLNAKTQERGSQLSIAAGFLDDTRGAWITIGGVIGLQRADRFGRVLSSAELQMRTGQVRSGDIFILTTAAAAGMLDDIDELFQQGYQLSGVESSLERLIRTQPQQDQSALALIEVAIKSGESAAEPAAELEPPLQSLADVAVIQIEQTVTSVVPPTESSVPPMPNSAKQPTTQPSKKLALSAIITTVVKRLKKSLSHMPSLFNRAKHSGTRAGSVTASYCRRLYLALKRALSQIPWRSWLHSKRARWVAASIGIIVLLLVVVALTISWQKSQAAASAAEAVAPFQQQLTAVQAQAVTNPVEAQAALDELTNAIGEQILAATEKPVAAGLQSFLGEVRQYEATLKGEVAVRSLPVVMDLQTVVPGFVATLADGNSGNGFYVDLSKKLAILVNFSSRETQQFDLGTIETITSVTMRTPTEAVILGDGIYSLQLKPDAAPILEKPVGDSNRAATLISSYGSYIYVFNPEKRNIFRHLVRKDGYSDPIGWLLSPLGVPAESIYAMKVDGDVWLGTKDGQLKKFTSGRSTSFTPTNLEQPLEGPIQPYVSEIDRYLYAFVPTQQRVVVMTKDGMFVKQIKSEVLSGALAVVADELAGKLYAISGSVIYQASL